MECHVFTDQSVQRHTVLGDRGDRGMMEWLQSILASQSVSRATDDKYCSACWTTDSRKRQRSAAIIYSVSAASRVVFCREGCQKFSSSLVPFFYSAA